MKRKKTNRMRPREFDAALTATMRKLQEELIQSSAKLLDPLPSLRELSQRYKIKVGVARNVFDHLETLGFIEKRDRKGAFLLQNPSEWRFEREKIPDSLGFVPRSDLEGKTIGLVGFLQRQHPAFAFNRTYAMCNSLRAFCHKFGARSFLFNTYPACRVTDRLIKEIKDRAPDGLVFVPDPKEMLVEGLESLRRLEIPLIVAYVETPFVDNVTISDEAMAYEATRHLLDIGHRHIIFLRFDSKQHWNLERDIGFRRAINSFRGSDLKSDEFTLPYDQLAFEDYEITYLRILKRELPQFIAKGVTAFVCSAPVVGMAVLENSRNLGIRVPEDIAFINIGDTFLYEHENMTAIRFPVNEVGKTCFEMLVKRIQNPSSVTLQIRVPGELIQCGTT